MLGKTFILIAVLSAPVAAYAQISVPTQTESESNFLRDRNTSVTERSRAEYEPLGLRAGAFRISPSLLLASEWNDNVFYTDDNEKSDRFWKINPAVTVQSDWSRHSLGVNASSTTTKYDDLKTEDADTYTFGANGRLDIARQTNITASASKSKLTESRGAPNAPALAASAPEYTVESEAIALDHEFNRLKVNGRYDHRAYDYKSVPLSDGTTLTQNSRDYKSDMFTGRADYAVSPATAIFTSVSLTKKDYTRVTGALQDPRTSDGFSLLIGANFDVTNVMRGEVAFGYAEQDFDSTQYKDLNAVAVRGQIEWFPTQLLTMTLNANRSLEDAAQFGVGGYDTTDVGVRADYELRRNLLLAAHLEGGRDTFQGGGRTDRRNGAGVGATYLMNRIIGLALDYNYAKRDSRGVNAIESYSDNRVTAGLVVKF
jgi:hypothetical protein